MYFLTLCLGHVLATLALGKDLTGSDVVRSSEKGDVWVQGIGTSLLARGRARRSDCHCGDGSIDCYVQDDGRIACECENDRYVIGGSCSDCKCHNGLCNIESGECECWGGHILVRGRNLQEHTCQKCNCGDETIPCQVVDGVQLCDCPGGFISVNSTCTECACGNNAKCSLENGSKVCTCLDGFEDNNGNCESCSCSGGGRCEFVEGKPKCKTEETSGHLFDGDSCEDCVVLDGGFSGDGFSGSGSDSNLCEEVEGKKICLCPNNYADNGGTCERCSCGGDHSLCRFEEGEKVCFCEEGYARSQDGKCHELCDPDLCDKGKCEKDEADVSRCKCDEGFTGRYCDKEIMLIKEIIILIFLLTAVTLFWITLVAIYVVRRRKAKSSKEHFFRRDNDILLNHLKPPT